MTGTFLLTVVDTLSILFMGDVMQHRQQLHSALIPGTDSTLSSSYDYSSYFAHVQHFIDEADFTVANMEFCLGGPPYTGYPSFSAPEALAEEAAEAGIDLFLPYLRQRTQGASLILGEIRENRRTRDRSIPRQPG